jgi:predicted ATP-grasp superfamily ATP-dependent carboligase
MSEGSSLSARESLTGLGRAGFHVEVVDGNPLCLARFSKFCRRLHAAPRFGADPRGYLERVVALVASRRFDVLYPAHEQAFLFARFRDRLSPHVAVALPDFSAFLRLQSKVGFAALLDELGLPAPPTTVAHDEDGIRRAAAALPVYVKAAFGTATQGVHFVHSAGELAGAIDALRPTLDKGVVIQRPVRGGLARMIGVFAEGELVGFHANRQAEAGVGGGDLVKVSMPAAGPRRDMARIGQRLGWHGGLAVDYIVDAEGTPRYIDANPRLAEPGNALAAGLNLPELLVRVSLGESPPPAAASPPGVRSHMGVQGLLRAAKENGRAGVLSAAVDLARRRGIYASSGEELTPTTGDARAALPLALVGGAMLVNPGWWRRFASATIDAYALTPAVLAFMRESG